MSIVALGQGAWRCRDRGLAPQNRFKDFVCPDREWQRQEQREVSAYRCRDQVAGRSEGRDILGNLRGLLGGNRTRRGGHHAARAHARAHGECERIKEIQASHQPGKYGDEHGAEHRTRQIFRKHALAFGGLHAEALADDRKARLAADRKGRANRLALDTEQQRNWQPEYHRAEEVTKFLEDQPHSRGREFGNGRAHQQPELCDKEQKRWLEDCSRRILQLGVDAHAGGHPLCGKAERRTHQQRP